MTRPSDLREACVQEALSIIETSGVEQLSLREVARRLGVSHQAPYKHFPSRDHILAEIVARAFDSFARYLDGRDKTGDPDQDLGEMGRAYLRYAQAHPLQYRLMFGTPLPEPHAHPEMMRNARHAFALLSDGLQRLSGEQPSSEPSDDVLLDALFIWSALHGLASISGSCVVETLDLPTKLLEGAGPHVLNRIGAAMGRADC
ncbi:MAG: TetR/AcrR family transcriptional regulator [Pseudomonadota bacterium]